MTKQLAEMNGDELNSRLSKLQVLIRTAYELDNKDYLSDMSDITDFLNGAADLVVWKILDNIAVTKKVGL